MRTIRFGVIGCGLMGREFGSASARWCHLLDFPVRPQITAVCDPNEAATRWFSSNFSLDLVTTDYRELLAADIDAVYCAVPHNLHEEIYIATLEAGKHLFAEKPFGIDLPAAERIFDRVERHPELVVRCSGEFPFLPAAQRVVKMLERGEFGQVIEIRAGFLHSSDLDPQKPINWKRQIAPNGEYGCMGDLGLHVLHLPIRFGFAPATVRALLSKIVKERPDGRGGMAACETWDNAVLACTSADGVPLILETKRISPGDMNTWYVEVYGTLNSAKFSTKNPKTLWTMPYSPGKPQGWVAEDVGYASVYPTITGGIFEFGFSDAIVQMWASYLDELNGGQAPFRCATPEEALASHRVFTAALMSWRDSSCETVNHS